MTVISCCCKCSAICVLLFAVLLGVLLSGQLAKTGIFAHLDQLDTGRGQALMGMSPAVHIGTSWGFTLQEIPDLTGETIFVTGGNVGLGYWTAYHLASKGATVVIGCRSTTKCDQAAAKIKAETGKDVSTALLDLSSLGSVRACAEAFAQKHPVLDSLILNAGVMMPDYGLTADGLEIQIGTNHFGHFLLTKLLLPQLEAAASARGVATVVAVASNAHYSSYPEGILPSIERMNDASIYSRTSAYGQSKLANVLFAQELAERYRDKGILANSLNPGAVDTELGRHLEELIKKTLGSAVQQYLKETIKFQWHPKDAALTQIYAAVGPKLRKEKITGRYFAPIAREAKPDLHTFNSTLQKKLWDLTEGFLASH
eukprot:TRINITY_DN53159_c0_g1_i1.p1 TRINITY_DN53159_c0_g1~~TRINITY_DN53159_c0_g1_i1.p1  ORF type:complete len:371 (-),score=71.70 TRINITY_DN53159_c0_g1_i1:145-1257(-)